MRDHVLRRVELLDAALQVGWEEAQRQGLQEDLAPSFQRCSTQLAALRNTTANIKEPNVWLILLVLGALIAYIVIFIVATIISILVDRDLVNHDQHEVELEQELAKIYGRLGYSLPFPDRQRVKGEHNYVARVIVAILLPFYTFWWQYNLMNEGNRNFRTNWDQEDALASAVEAIGPHVG